MRDHFKPDLRLLALILGAAFAIRMVVSGLLPNFLHPDELLQYLEQGHRMAFGYGIVPWEFQVGSRSWLFPGAIGIVMYLAALIGDSPAVYLRAVDAALAALSLAPIAFGYLWAYRREGRSAAVVTGIVLAVWFELVYFSTRALTTPAAAHSAFCALLLAGPTQDNPNRRSLFASGAMLALALVLRPQLVPALGVIAAVICNRDIRRWFALSAGGLVFLLMQGALDAFTWSYPFQSLIEYVRRNYFGGFADSFGVTPWYQYAIDFARMWSWWGIAAVALLIAGARRNEWLLAVAMTVIVSHSFIGRKEPRFIYLALPFLMIVISIGCARLLARWCPRGLGSTTPAAALTALLVFVPVTLALGAGYNTGGKWGPLVGTYWTSYRNVREAFLYVHPNEDICGLALAGVEWWQSGYAFLHRDVPMVQLRSEEEWAQRASMANYLLIRQKLELLDPSYERVAQFGGIEVRKRPGGCTDATGADINADLRM